MGNSASDPDNNDKEETKTELEAIKEVEMNKQDD